MTFPCELTCPDHGNCPPAGRIDLADAVARFDREATRATLDTGRYRLRYYTWGKGPPLTFIHGVGDWSRSVLMVVSRLVNQFRCIAYDLPGMPGDGANLWRYRHDDLVDDLYRLLDHLSVPRSYVVGSSFGATIALRAMKARPERLPRAVLQGGVACRPLRPAEWWLSWLGRVVPGRTGGIPRREKVLAKVHRPAFEGRGEEWWRAYVDWTGEVRTATLAHQARMLGRLDLRADLPSIRQPVLLLSGDRDTTTTLTQGEVLRQGLPNCGTVILEGAGHVPCYSHPEAYAEVVRQFLTPPGQQAGCPMAEVCHGAKTCS